MIRPGTRRGGNPVIQTHNGFQLLERLSLTGEDFSEEWIQDHLDKFPKILPVQEFDPAFGPAIPIGREVTVKAGSIDNLYISPEGYLTILEAKLWRNPEARRKVIGQLIDYARELSKWTFSELDESVKKYTRQKENKETDLVAYLAEKGHIAKETSHEFIDSVSRNLKKGRFLLLVAGDGIREEVEEMAAYLSDNPQIHFTLGLLELQVYRLPESENTLIIPQIITRTREITRAIVKLEGAVPQDLNISIQTEPVTLTSDQKRNDWMPISSDEFFAQLENNQGKQMVEFVKTVISDCEELGLIPEWNSKSLGIKYLDPNGSGTRITVFTIDRTGYFYLGYSDGQLEKLGVPMDYVNEFSAASASLMPEVEQNPERKSTWKTYGKLRQLIPVYIQFKNVLQTYLARINKSVSQQINQ